MKATKNILLVILVIGLAIFPLILRPGANFAGADSQAEEAISEVSPGYQPWFHSLWKPPSGEIETFLFAVQAAIGSGVVFYYFGYRKGKKAGLRQGVKD